MNKSSSNKIVKDGKDPNNLRGDPITNDRYFCKDFLLKEFQELLHW